MATTRAARRPRQEYQRQYEEHVQAIRSLKNQGTRCEVEAMCLVLDLEAARWLWRDRFHNFTELLEHERFNVTPAAWKAFRRARSFFPRKDKFVAKARSLGVPAVCLIGKQPKETWFRLFREAEAFREDHDVEPTYQHVTRLIRKRRKAAGPSRARLLAMLAASQRNVATLMATLRRHKIRIPRLEIV